MTEYMACGGIDPGNSFLWLTLGGIFFGGGFSFILNLRSRRRPAVFITMLSAAVLFMLAAFYTAGFSLEKVRIMLVWSAVFAAAGYAGFFFWKSIGIPLVFALAVIIVLVWSALLDWRCVVPGREICSLTVLSEGDDYIRIQYKTPGGAAELADAAEQSAYPVLTVIHLPDYFFLAKSGEIYSFRGFSARDESASLAGTGLKSRILDVVTGLPGTAVENSGGRLVLSPSVKYRLLFNQSGRPELVRNMN